MYGLFPPNSTHLLQPLDVAVYGPMKKAWRKVLSDWKQTEGRFYTTLPKTQFPRLLYALMEHQSMEHRSEWAKSGFRTTGIYPLDRDQVLRKLKHSDKTDASHLVSPILIDRLRELRESNTKKSNRGRRGKAILVIPVRVFLHAMLGHLPQV